MEKENNPLSKSVSLIFDIFDCIAGAIIVASILLTFIFIKFEVVGDSMYPTLHNTDKLLVYHFMYNPQKGDIITIDKPGVLDKNIVKRIIAVPGDRVNIDYDSGKVFVNGELLKEEYINTPTNLKATWTIPETIPEGYVFVMGDNRNHSSDSRSSAIRLIEYDKIMGKVLFRYSPSNRIKVFSEPYS